jgi:hypothetical protein
LASTYGYHTKTKKFNLEDLAARLDNQAISYNEVIKQENKLFFDIDDSYNELNFQKCLELIEKMICKFRHQAINVDYAYSKTTSASKPHSYHVVY